MHVGLNPRVPAVGSASICSGSTRGVPDAEARSATGVPGAGGRVAAACRGCAAGRWAQLACIWELKAVPVPHFNQRLLANTSRASRTGG